MLNHFVLILISITWNITNLENGGLIEEIISFRRFSKSKLFSLLWTCTFTKVIEDVIVPFSFRQRHNSTFLKEIICNECTSDVDLSLTVYENN
jgi:hypothetical protein